MNMQKLVFGILVGFLVACGGNNNNKVVLIDSAGSGSDMTCNILTQTGCNAGEKCAWVRDQSSANPLGHLACAPDGSMPIGGACTYGPDGVMGYDNCAKGGVCLASTSTPAASGKCSQICDQNGGTPMCQTGFACGLYSGLLEVGGMNVAGVCDPTCDPLADNDFDGSGSDTKTGTACAGTRGCYGFPGQSAPTHATCSGDGNNRNIGQRVACTVANGCAHDSTHSYLNGCSQGYIPLYPDSEGSSQVDCISFCRPADCSSNAAIGCINNGGGTLPNQACTNLHHIGTFSQVNATNNADQCFYSWNFEYDSMQQHVPSPTSDSLGYCLDHSKYKYDSNGDGSADTTWPACNAMDVGSNVTLDGAGFGCVSTVTATAHNDPPFVMIKHRPLIDLPRAPYHVVAKIQ
jgi:hypothetical protein